MYGGTPLYDGISQFTFGHAADGTAPDDIIHRPKVFMSYVKRAAELIDLMYPGLDSQKDKDAIAQIQKIVDWAVNSYQNGILDDEGTKHNDDKFMYFEFVK